MAQVRAISDHQEQFHEAAPVPPFPQTLSAIPKQWRQRAAEQPNRFHKRWPLRLESMGFGGMKPRALSEIWQRPLPPCRPELLWVVSLSVGSQPKPPQASLGLPAAKIPEESQVEEGAGPLHQQVSRSER